MREQEVVLFFLDLSLCTTKRECSLRGDCGFGGVCIPKYLVFHVALFNHKRKAHTHTAGALRLRLRLRWSMKKLFAVHLLQLY